MANGGWGHVCVKMCLLSFGTDPHLHEAWKTSATFCESPWIAPKWRVVARAPKGRAKVGSQHPFFFFET
jgi:hypothetical protein